jgi:UDP-glucose:(glucosyl)LPS alpha-1,2-glucosyltransferase
MSDNFEFEITSSKTTKNKNDIVEQSKNARSGTELMYEWITNRLPKHLKDEFQIIASRVRDLEDGKKKILWLHDLHHDPEAQHLKDQESLERFSKLVFVGHWQKEMYQAYLGVPYDACTVIMNGIVPIPEHKKPKKGEKIKLYYASTPHRGLELLVPAFDYLCKERDDIELHVFSSFKIYGWEGADERFEPLYDHIKNHKNMVYHGTVSNEELRTQIQQMHIMALPSVYQESHSVAVTEAMSGMCHVVRPRYGGLVDSCLDFGSSYDWSGNPDVHVHKFVNCLRSAIDDYWSERTQRRLLMQRDHFHEFYNIDDRAVEWINMMEELR